MFPGVKTPCSFAGNCRRFGATYYLLSQSSIFYAKLSQAATYVSHKLVAFVFQEEFEGNRFALIVRTHLPVCTVS